MAHAAAPHLVVEWTRLKHGDAGGLPAVNTGYSHGYTHRANVATRPAAMNASIMRVPLALDGAHFDVPLHAVRLPFCESLVQKLEQLGA